MPKERPSRARVTEETKFIFTTADICELFEISRETLSRWEKKGAPKEGRGKWNIKEVMEWRFKTDSKSGEASAVVRKLKAEADLKEIKKQQEAIRLAVQEGKYISIEQTSRDLARLFTSLKNKLLAIGHKVAVEVNGLDPEVAALANGVIEDCIREALEQLAEGGVYGRKK